MRKTIIHPFEPVYDKDSRCLILGSLPSVKSRAQGFYYAHPQNRFWTVIAAVTGSTLPVTVLQKRQLLSAHGLALWDVIRSCEIEGSSDSSIQNALPNDFSRILRGSSILRIITNGKKADALYRQFVLKETGIESVCLPSTSPANARWRTSELILAWQDALLPFIKSF